MNHLFTEKIIEILKSYYKKDFKEIFDQSDLLKYINIKTKSANKGSKSRGSFANLYAIYVLLEDYKIKGYLKKDTYNKYEGAIFSDLFSRQRELPFGSKLQNHALNHRLNEEFSKYFPTNEYKPILRNVETSRYWFNEKLIKIKVNRKHFNLCESILTIIDEYIKIKKDSFEKFIKACEDLQKISIDNVDNLKSFLLSLLEPNVDARLFEIISYSILKYFYFNQVIYWGFDKTKIEEDKLKLFKTGRTNANDGGIDFVMKPLGRFFQVTETLDVNKYFLDIDKIEKFPITFVIKSKDKIDFLFKLLKENATKKYPIDEIVNKYLSCIEEIINIDVLVERFNIAISNGFLKDILDEIIKQSKVEFNYEDDLEDDD